VADDLPERDERDRAHRPHRASREAEEAKRKPRRKEAVIRQPVQISALPQVRQHPAPILELGAPPAKLRAPIRERRPWLLKLRDRRIKLRRPTVNQESGLIRRTMDAAEPEQENPRPFTAGLPSGASASAFERSPIISAFGLS
jgi:hypothetical protein